MKCYNCGHEIVSDSGLKINRQDVCSGCGSYLHCCFNCRFYDPVAWKECREPEAERVNNKKMANFCAYFEPCVNETVYSENRAEQARQKLENLFSNPNC